uniref:Reverse transcriptase domain-containing protein n=1 Tax=Strongyloides venezuelensis TaxID=75913 RepID=A0A0K0FZ98_STRVS
MSQEGLTEQELIDLFEEVPGVDEEEQLDDKISIIFEHPVTESVNIMKNINVSDVAKDIVNNNVMNLFNNLEKKVKNFNNTNVAREFNGSKHSGVEKGNIDVKSFKDKKHRNFNEVVGPIPKFPRGSSKNRSVTGSSVAEITEATQLRVVEATKSSDLLLGDFIAVLEKNTRTIEAQLFMEQLGHVSPKPYGQTMIMSITSFCFWDAYINAINGDKWREEAVKARRHNKKLVKPRVIDYGSIDSTQDLKVIYDAIHEVASGGMTMFIIGTRLIILPSYNIPK